MCYNNCQYENYNPMTGDCHCRRGSNPCPEEEELIMCPYCETEQELSDTCTECGATLQEGI